jgi:hypothetical protein
MLQALSNSANEATSVHGVIALLLPANEEILSELNKSWLAACVESQKEGGSRPAHQLFGVLKDSALTSDIQNALAKDGKVKLTSLDNVYPLRAKQAERTDCDSNIVLPPVLYFEAEGP